MAFFLVIVVSHLTGIAGGPLLFTLNSIVSYCQGGVLFLFEALALLLFAIKLGGLIGMGQSGVLPLVDFTSLDLDSSVWGFLAVISGVYNFEEVLWDGWWSWKQRIFESWIMVLDLSPALASMLTALCIISSKFMDSRFCCSISTLMEGLRPSQK